MTHAYKCFLSCGCLNALAVDTSSEPDFDERQALVEMLADYILKGGHVDRVPLDEARDSARLMVVGHPHVCPGGGGVDGERRG